MFILDNEFSFQMLKLGLNNNETAKKRLIVSCSFLIVVFVAMAIGTHFLFEKVVVSETKIFYTLAYITSNFYTTLFLLGFNLILSAIFRRFEAINQCIKDNFKTDEDEPDRVYDKKNKSAEKMIIKLADLHDMMTDVTNDANKCLAFEVLCVDSKRINLLN